MRAGTAAVPKLGLLRMVVLSLLAAAAAGAQAGRYFARILPDTLWPGQSGMFPIPDSIRNARNWPEAVLLKRGTTTMGLNRYDGDYSYYQLAAIVPANAAIGSYNAYSESGTLLESNVTYVEDALRMPRRITMTRLRVRRGAAISLQGSVQGLVFGPLPRTDTSRFVPDVKYIGLEKGTDSLPVLWFNYELQPESFWVDANVPFTAAFGYYHLVVLRNEGARTVLDSAVEIYAPPAPSDVEVTPDTLWSDWNMTVGITGLNLDYGSVSGSDVYLNRRILVGVHLRHGSEILPASSLKGASTRSLLPIQAQFIVPPSFPLGPCDLGFVSGERGDTTYFPGIVNVIAPVGIVPPLAGAGPPAHWRGDRLSLSLTEPAWAELRTLSGRVLFAPGLLPAGEQELRMPPAARGEAVLLWRLRASGREVWLKITRAP